MIPDMKLAYLTWEGFATLTTGILAVGGAVYVGAKQAKIAKAQTEILSRQTDIGERAVRVDAFDRRMAVFKASSNWLSYIETTGNVPGMTQDRSYPEGHEQAFWKHGAEQQRAFITGMEEARFLFHPRVHEELERLHLLGTQLDYLTSRDLITDVPARLEVHKIPKIRSELRSARKSLWKIFEPDMSLPLDLKPASDG